MENFNCKSKIMIKHSIPLEEPQRGKDLLVQTNEAFVSCETTAGMAPVLTDWLVMTYPMLLIVMYLIWLRSDSARYGEWRYGALYIFSTAVGAALTNVVIQYMVDKQRPEWYIDNAEMLILDHLPTAPFPSDHAAVWAGVAMATLLWATRRGHIGLTIVGVFLWIGSLVMSVSRVGVAIHRPTDVLAGTILGVIVAVLIHGLLYRDSWLRRLFSRLISVQEWLWKLVGIGGQKS